MTIIYIHSSVAILIAAVSTTKASAFVQVLQGPKFASRAMSTSSSSLSMVGSEDYLNLLGQNNEEEGRRVLQDEAWMPEIPTPQVQARMLADMQESTQDAFVQEEFEAAAAAMALEHEEMAYEAFPESVMYEETPEPVVMMIEEVDEPVAMIEEQPVMMVDEPDESVMKINEVEKVVEKQLVDEPEPVAVAEKTIPRSHALVPINEETLEFTSGVVGGIVGLALAGPVGGVFGSTIFNFFSRQMDGDVTEAINNTAKKSIELYNYLSKLDAKYDILNGSKQSLTRSIEKIKESGSVSPEAAKTVKKLEARLDQVKEKIDQVNNEYDVTTNVLLALDKFGDIVERTVKKSFEFEKKNGLAGKLVNAWSQAIEKALEAADDTKRKSSKK